MIKSDDDLSIVSMEVALTGTCEVLCNKLKMEGGERRKGMKGKGWKGRGQVCVV